jgi:two-component system nitrate/nitrite response regulator NarL
MRRAVDIVVAHDNVIFVDALTHVLIAQGHRVVAAAATTSDLIAEVIRRKPAIAILDDSVPGGWLTAVERIADHGERTRVVVLSQDRRSETLRSALDAGVFAFVHTSRGLDVLLRTLDRVMAGEVVVEASFVRASSGATPAQLATSELTAREVECLLLLAEGLDTNAIAGRLGVSTATVRTHVQGVLTKLGMHSRLEAASWALRSGMIDRAANEGDWKLA